MPRWLTKCKVFVGLSVILMTAGSVTEMDWIRGWSLLVAVYAVGLFLKAAMCVATKKVLEYIQKWAHQTFEDGFKGGVEVGREMEAAERFIAATRERD